MDYSQRRLRTKFGERAFSHAGPATWNALPDHIRTVPDPVKFRKLLISVAPPEASPLWVDVQKSCNMCVLSLSWNFFVSHDHYQTL